MKKLLILMFVLSIQLITSCKKPNSDTSDNQNTSTLKDSLIAFINFNDSLFDKSGNNNNGTAFGGNYLSELGGNKSYYFNGNGDYIKINNSTSLNPANALSISLWFRPVDFAGNGTNAIIVKPFTSHSTPYYQYLLGVTGSSAGPAPYNFTLDVSVNGLYKGINTGANTWIAGNWYHVVGIYDGHTMKLYVNSELKNSLSIEGTITGYDTDVFLGGHPNIDIYTPGTIDNIRLYNRALTEKEITELFNEEFK